MRYLCDVNRHLICDPYSIPNLHTMARNLGINKCWFHNTPGLAHYDIPKRRIDEITEKCDIIPTMHIIKMIRSADLA